MLAKLRHAGELWAQGDKCLAQIHLEYLRLPRLESEEQAFRLFPADRLIASGYSSRDLCRALGFDLPEGLRKYNPDEPRDDHGRWTTARGERAIGFDWGLAGPGRLFAVSCRCNEQHGGERRGSRNRRRGRRHNPRPAQR